MICADCQTACAAHLAKWRHESATPAREATHRVYLTGFGHPFALCGEHAFARDDAGEVARAVRIVRVA